MSGRRFLPNGRTRLLGILGDPVEHSLSPGLHSRVLQMMDRNWLYIPVPVSRPRLRSFLAMAEEIGFVGLNVTTPFKERIFRLIEPEDSETLRTRMVNTITLRDGQIHGRGTDGRGILDYLGEIGFSGEPIGVLGFGATARSLVHCCWLEGMTPIQIVTRRKRAVQARLRVWQTIDPRRASLRGDGPRVDDWSLGGDVPLPRVWVSTLPPETKVPVRFWERLPRGSVLVDMNYGEGRDSLARVARSRGYRAADGLGPLLGQARLSLEGWLGEPIDRSLFRRAASAGKGRLAPRR